MTYPLLQNAPPHSSPEFIEYLRENNEIVKEYDHFLLIANCKYDTPEKRHYTTFWKHTEKMRNSLQFTFGLSDMLDEYPDWEWLKKAAKKQTVSRWHIHLIEPV